MYKYTDNTTKIKNETRVKGSIFLRLMTDQIVGDAKDKTPKKDHNLSRDILKQVLGLQALIVWRKKYAAVQERGERADGTYKIRKYTTPGTGPGFARAAVEKGILKTPAIAARAQLI